MRTPETEVSQKFCSYFVTGRVERDTGRLFPSYSDYRDSSKTKAMRDAIQPRRAENGRASNRWRETKAS